MNEENKNPFELFDFNTGYEINWDGAVYDNISWNYLGTLDYISGEIENDNLETIAWINIQDDGMVSDEEGNPVGRVVFDGTGSGYEGDYNDENPYSQKEPDEYYGYHLEGYNQEGFDREGYDRGGYNREGYDREGYNQEGFDNQGLDSMGYNQDGFDNQGFDSMGYNQDGFDNQGFDSMGYNQDGFDNQEGEDYTEY